MRNHYLLIFLLTILAHQAHAQTTTLKPYPKYYHLVREAKIHSKNGYSKLALKQFKAATKTVSYVHTHNWAWAAMEAEKAGDCKLALKYFKKAVQQGYEIDFSKPLDGPVVSKIKNCTGFTKAYITDLQELNSSYKATFDHSLQQLLDSLHTKDQQVRLDKTIAKDKWTSIDSSNIQALKQIIGQYGYPDERLVGAETARKIFYVILHYDSDTNNTVMGDLLFKALHEGKLTPQNYAWVVDRRLNWGPAKKDPYYYQMPSRKIPTLSDAEKKEINQRRHLIGLKTLEEMNITFKPDGGMSVMEDWTDF